MGLNTKYFLQRWQNKNWPTKGLSFLWVNSYLKSILFAAVLVFRFSTEMIKYQKLLFLSAYLETLI